MRLNIWVAPAPIVLTLLAAIAAGRLGAPAASATTALETVDPALCLVEPISVTDFIAIVELAPQPTPDPGDDDAGQPADDETVGEIEAVVRESVACVNANDPMRSFALFTGRYLRERFGGDNGDDIGHLLASLTREASPAPEADRLSIVSVEDVVFLEDGRVHATVRTENANDRFTDRLIFERADAGWQIDQVIFGKVETIAT